MTSAVSMPWGDCLLPSAVAPPALASEVRRELGAVPSWITRLAPCPWLVRASARWGSKPWTYAPIPLWNLVELVVSQDNSCRYCYGVQRALLKIAGYGDAELSRLERDFDLAELTGADRAALEFARQLSRADPRPGRAEYELLEHAGLGAPAIAEIAFGVAAGAFSNRIASLLALPPEGDLERLVEGSLFRALRPLIAFRMRPRPKPRTPLTADDGLGAAVVFALGDSPSADVVRRTIADAFHSEILPRRTKALLLAVVAKALGCAYFEREARGVLVAEGLETTTIADVLTNLASPRLDRREAALVPFARETVRYQPVDIQRRTREVTDGMTPEETIELVGVVALANAVCRLSVLLDVC